MEASFKHLGTVLYLHVTMQVFIGLLFDFFFFYLFDATPFLSLNKYLKHIKVHISACEVLKLALSH